MICKNCGENLPNNVLECFTCGAAVKREAVVADEATVSKEPVAEKQVPAAEFFSKVFANSDYFKWTLLVTLLAVIVVIKAIIQGFSGEWSGLVSSAADAVLYALLVVPAWSLYVNAPVLKSASSFKKAFNFFRIYTVIYVILHALSAIAVVVICFIGLAVSGALNVASALEMAAATVIYFILATIPALLAHKFTSSMCKSAANDSIKLERIIELSGFMLAFGILLVLGSVIDMVQAVWSFGHGDYIGLLDALSQIAKMIFYFITYSWLKSVRQEMNIVGA